MFCIAGSCCSEEIDRTALYRLNNAHRPTLQTAGKVTLTFDTALAIALITVGILFAAGVIPSIGSGTPYLASGCVALGLSLFVIDGLVVRIHRERLLGHFWHNLAASNEQIMKRYQNLIDEYRFDLKPRMERLLQAGQERDRRLVALESQLVASTEDDPDATVLYNGNP